MAGKFRFSFGPWNIHEAKDSKPAVGFILLLVMSFLLLLSSGCTNAGDWANISISRGNDGIENVVIENRVLLIRYGQEGTKQKRRYDRMVEFRLKTADAILAAGLDGRHTTGDTRFYRLTDASVEYDGAQRKAVRLDFGNGARIEHVSIFKGAAAVKIDYEGDGHNLDYRIKGGKYEIYGSEQWQQMNNWSKKYITLQDDITCFGSYFRSDGNMKFKDAGPLDYHGSMIMGVYGDDGLGVGLVLPTKQVKWLKLIGTLGFERWTNGAHTAWLYAVTGGAEQLISFGKILADGGIPAFEVK